MDENKKNFCHDCGREIRFEGEEIKNGVFLAYQNAGEKIHVFKCQDCYDANKSLTNYQPCEVYSRVVGYIRPVNQWHKGKKEEFSERKTFSMPKDSCCN
jgi:ribonucleoside-triphosphate reductase